MTYVVPLVRRTVLPASRAVATLRQTVVTSPSTTRPIWVQPTPGPDSVAVPPCEANSSSASPACTAAGTCTVNAVLLTFRVA